MCFTSTDEFGLQKFQFMSCANKIKKLFLKY